LSIFDCSFGILGCLIKILIIRTCCRISQYAADLRCSPQKLRAWLGPIHYQLKIISRIMYHKDVIFKIIAFFITTLCEGWHFIHM